MNLVLSCGVCDFQAWGSTEKHLINKIVMWNHVKRSHAAVAEEAMRTYQTQPLPTDLYEVRQTYPVTA